MTTEIPISWIHRLFTIFREIYGERAQTMSIDVQEWKNALRGITVEQIKLAISTCRSEPETVPTPGLFAQLCRNQPVAKPEPQEELTPGLPFYPYVKRAITKPEPRPVGWENRLLEMDDKTALQTLSHADQYERTRLLLAREGQVQCERHRTIYEENKNYVETRRKDWE